MIPVEKIATVIQARMSSTRLPYKVMLSLAGKPLLQRLYERVNASVLKGSVIIATSTDSSDDPVENFCKSEGIRCYRGSLNDLLQRHLGAAETIGAEFVIKIPSDVPLIDTGVIGRVVTEFFRDGAGYDYLSNLHPATYPDGNDVEIMKIDALRKADREATKDFEREHTTPYLWENPHLFKIGNVTWETGYDYSMSHRWTIDYEEDYLFIKTVYDELWSPDYHFSMIDILNLLDRKPSIAAINSKFAGVNWYRHHLNELHTISSEQTKIL
ncbi:MAG: glycosyltransferase family protein [Bacteroidetes bacterium]|nr:glycosyltransferase family protein [Bacteroidota bacterium]